MGNLNSNAQGDTALASVDADAAASAFLMNRGFSALVRNGAGDYSLTLTNAQLMTTQAVVMAQLRVATPGLISVVATSTVSLQVLTWSCTVGAGAATAAADIDFYVRITPVAPA